MGKDAPPDPERPQSLGEEIASAVSHGAGFLAALVAGPLLVAAAARRGSPHGVVGTAVFIATILLLYSASTLYHALPRNRAKRVFRVLDGVPRQGMADRDRGTPADPGSRPPEPP